MMDDDSERPSASQYPLAGSGPKLSRTPSWVMLGFVLGALFVYAMMRQDEPEAPVAVQARVSEAPQPPPPVRRTATLSTIEAVFAVWGKYATWTEDVTEVALWNKEERKFADFYEVRRIGGVYYFRSIPELTRRVIRHGKVMPDSPLQFTETEEEYREWLEHGRSETRPEVEAVRAPSPPGITPPRVSPQDPSGNVKRGP